MSRLMGDLIVDLEGHWNEVVYYSQELVYKNRLK